MHGFAAGRQPHRAAGFGYASRPVHPSPAAIARMIRPPTRTPAAVLVLVLLAVVAPGAAHAEQVAGLYEGQVPVSGRDPAERVTALGAALRQVLSKLSGLQAPGGPVVDAAADEPERFLQQFSYKDTPDAELAQALWARFDAAAVDQLMSDAGLPRWGAQRPGLLAWVEVAGADGLGLVAPDDGSGVAAALARRAWERGLALSFPLLDLEDRVRVSAGALWDLGPQEVAAVSARYAPGATLVGRVESTGTGTWDARWRLHEAGEIHFFESRGLSPADTAAGAIDAATDVLAARYAVADAEGSGTDVAVEVLGVRNLDDYARALDYLGGLDAISGLRLSGAWSDRLAFRMQVRGGAEGLRRVASFGGVLAEEAPSQDGALRFRLLP